MEKLTNSLANKFVITDLEDQDVAVEDNQADPNITTWNPFWWDEFSGAIFAPLIETEYVQTLESGEGL